VKDSKIELSNFRSPLWKYREKLAGEQIDLAGFFPARYLAAGTEQEIDAPYAYVQLASGGTGACFCYPEDLDLESLKHLVGRNPLDVQNLVSRVVELAVLDAIYARINELDHVRASEVCYFEGTYAVKSAARAQKLASLAPIIPGSKVAVVGAVYDIIKAVQDLGASVRVADMGHAGESILGCRIERDGASIISNSEIALVTGNVLKTGTLTETVSSSNCFTVVFAMTGANIAPRYLQLGATVVASESFPYYWFAGVKSEMRIYRT
jgi:hypothetical protein